MNRAASSLEIGFGNDATMARLRARKGLEDELHRLSGRFRTGSIRSFGSAEVAVDDLLLNLGELATWPEPADVVWDPDLAALARDSTVDAQTVQARLRDGHPAVTDIGTGDIADVLGPDWTGALTSFQRRDIAHLLSLRHGANFSVPGAGKTRVGLAVFQALRRQGHVKRLLVVGPKSSFEAWQSENVECFHEPLRMDVMARAIDPAAEAVLVNYERLQGSLNQLARWISAQPTLMILDEAHRMKLGAEGAYGSACLALGPRARYRLILTGTPAPNGSKDLESLFGFVWPGHGRRTVTRAVAGGDLTHASRILRPLFARTTKAELELPPVTTTQREVDLPPLHREIYDALIGHYSARAVTSHEDFKAWGRITIYLLMAAISPGLLAVGTTKYEPLAYRVPPLTVPEGSPLMDLLRDLPSYELSPKYRETLAIVAANAAEGRKTIVWSTFIRSVTSLQQMLKEFSPAVVHGGTEDRETEIERFRRDSDCHVLLSNPATLGEGISLHHHCHDAVYVDRDFAAGRFMQSLDRIHRLGLSPETTTRITVLTSRETIDDVVTQRLEAKLQFMGRVLDDPAVQQLADLEAEPEVGGGLDERDLQSLMGHLRGHAA